MSDKEKHQEIIIIKRGGEGEHGHHGGAWKIAFADFMTAMMALFLVLWLINAANEETKKAVASYFNPVKLVDRNRSVKGLHDAEGVQEIEVQAPNEQFPEQNNDTEAAEEEQKVAEAQFFADPFTVLDQIADHKAPGEVQAIEEEGGRNGNDAINDAQGGEAFMDPFSPNFWNEEVRQSNDKGQLSGRYETDGEGVDAEGTAAEVIVAEPAEPAEDGVPATDNLAIRMGGKEFGETGGDMNAEAAGGAGEGQDKAAEMVAEAADGEVTETAAIGETPELTEAEAEAAKKALTLENAAEDLRGRISEKLAEVFGDDAELASEVSVEVSGGEILISLTDALNISMFELGSAVPSKDLVLALEKIGGVLAEQNGGIRIHGHTDARPFRSKDYDNWRLSASRAQSAYYMLLRGGLDETRVREISGFADRKLIDTEDPFSPANRRIEVLVEVDAG